MAHPGLVRSPAIAFPAATRPLRHSATVRITHWITTFCFFALLVSGLEIVISHPRFYWGETGNSLTPPLFELPIPASRASVPTGYKFVLPDQNGWSRSLHFQTAWLLVLTGLVYVVSGLISGHFRKNLVPASHDRSWWVLARAVRSHLRLKPQDEPESASYNVLQRLTYLLVIFALFPLMIWTGLAMSPAFTSAFPATVTTLGGQQSARTIHFLATLALVTFVLVHVLMISLAGFRTKMSAMITGDTRRYEDHA